MLDKLCWPLMFYCVLMLWHFYWQSYTKKTINWVDTLGLYLMWTEPTVGLEAKLDNSPLINFKINVVFMSDGLAGKRLVGSTICQFCLQILLVWRSEKRHVVPYDQKNINNWHCLVFGRDCGKSCMMETLGFGNYTKIIGLYEALTK